MTLPPFNVDYWFLQTLAMLVTALLIPGLKVSGPLGALTTVIAIAFFNSQAWDAALFFQIPDEITIHTGLLFLTNGILFLILVKLLPGIEVEGIMPALIAPVVFTATSLVISHYRVDIDWAQVIDYGIGVLEYIKSYFEQHLDGPSVSPPGLESAGTAEAVTTPSVTATPAGDLQRY